MATLLSSHPQFPHQQQLLPPPSSLSSFPPHPSSAGHFCKDCGVMFESSTSLEVHLSYHKENLLSRWATQDNMDNKAHHPPPPTTSASDVHHGGHYFPHPPPEHGHYIPPQYNNNTGDHHIGEYRGSNPGSFPPPVDSHSGHPLYPHPIHHAPGGYSSPALFSPGHSEGRNPGSIDPPPPREPSEILDLDSHKVHIYQQQAQAAAAAAAAAAERNNFFHRPYLSHLLPPQPPPPTNGWAGESHPAFSTNPSQGSPAGFPPESTYSASNGPSNMYDLGRNSGAGGPGGPPDILSNPGYPDPSGMSYQPPPRHLTPNGPAPPSFSNAGFPPKPEPPAPLMADSPEGRPRQQQSKNATPTPNSGTKTKGWKGGECKRPKTYNCSACNKWFTSSGHLKRHYGTTLHKNSIKQKGEMGEEVSAPPSSKQFKRSSGESRAVVSGAMEDPLDSSSSSPSRGMKLEESNSGKSTPIYAPSTPNNGSSRPPLPSGDILNTPSSGPFGSHLGLNGSNPPVPSPTPPFLDKYPGYISAYGGPPPPPTTTSGSSNGPPPSISVGNGHPLQPPPQYMQPQFHPMPPHPPVPYSNGFAPETMPMGNNGSFSVPSPAVPTTMYSSTSGPYVNLNGDSTPLPPFSSVGFSHYDHSFSHAQGQGAFPPNPSPTGNRATPPFQSQLATSPASRSSPVKNSDGSFDNSDIRMNRSGVDSPDSRSASGGSLEGSLDGLEGSSEGSPTSSTSDTSITVRDEGEVDVLKCPDCSKTFGRACYLTQHANSSHSGGKPFKCPTCGKRFPAAPALSHHVAKHGSEKPYKCDLCPKQFNHKTDLRRHLCLHTGEKPFVCNVCGKGFIRKDHMTKHCETHRKKSISSS